MSRAPSRAVLKGRFRTPSHGSTHDISQCAVKTTRITSPKSKDEDAPHNAEEAQVLGHVLHYTNKLQCRSGARGDGDRGKVSALDVIRLCDGKKDAAIGQSVAEKLCG
jgi:hypothetical protein